MNAQLLTHYQLKQQAKAKLNTGTTRRDLMIANMLPTLFLIVIQLMIYLAMWGLFVTFGPDKALSDPMGFSAYFSTHGGQINSFQVIQSLVLTMLMQGLNFSVLDNLRHGTKIRPLHALLTLFNGRWFWGIIAIWIYTYFLTTIGYAFFWFPGVILALGWQQAFFALKDGRDKGEHFSALEALVTSWRVMRGFKLDLIGLYLSLLGWYLLEQITFHLFDWAINPYLQMVHAAYYDDRATFYQREQMQS